MKQLKQIHYEHYDSLGDLPACDAALVKAAQSAAESAHAPYSHFKVGTAARLRSDRIISAANCESEVFPSGMCAERSLIYFHASNYADDAIDALSIVSSDSERECYPCGACRQALFDAEQRQNTPIRILMASSNTATVVESAQELLPFTFKL